VGQNHKLVYDFLQAVARAAVIDRSLVDLWQAQQQWGLEQTRRSCWSWPTGASLRITKEFEVSGVFIAVWKVVLTTDTLWRL